MRCGVLWRQNVGLTVLSRALAMIELAPRKGVIAGLDAPDDAASLIPEASSRSRQSIISAHGG
jgi:hypothetical protein